MKKAFIALGKSMGGGSDPEKALDAGLKMMKRLDSLFQYKGISDLQPAIRASKFMELLSPEYMTREKIPDDEQEINGPKSRLVPKLKRTTGTDDGPEYEYDINLFIQMLLDADPRNAKGKGKKGGSSLNLKDYVMNAKTAPAVGKILD